MKVLSLRDLMLCEELSHIPNEVSLIHPSNDSLVASLLEQVGFDTSKNWYYEASYHRDMQNKPAIGFQVIGEFSTKPEHKHLLSAFERIVVAGLTDVHLAKDLMEISGKRFNYNNKDEYEIGPKQRKPDPRYYSEDELLELGYTTGDEEDGYDDVQDSCEVITSQIRALEEIKLAVRGE